MGLCDDYSESVVLNTGAPPVDASRHIYYSLETLVCFSLSSLPGTRKTAAIYNLALLFYFLTLNIYI